MASSLYVADPKVEPNVFVMVTGPVMVGVRPFSNRVSFVLGNHLAG